MKEAFWRVTAVVAVAIAAAVAQAQVPGERLAGAIASVDGDHLILTSSLGDTTRVKLGPKLRVSLRAPMSVARLEPGMYVAITASPLSDGSLIASELRVFPESQRGLAEGHRPIAAMPGSTMTNATIRDIAAARSAPINTLTNATIASYSASDGGRRLTVTYKEGQQTVVLPDNVPVMMTEVGDRSALRTGAHVVVYATHGPDGGWNSERISVGKGDFAPPS